MNLRIQQLKSREPEYGVDYGDIEMRKISADVEDLVIDGSRINAQINSISLVERSGFELRQLSGKFQLGRGAIALDDLTIISSQSQLKFKRLMLSGREWSQYRRFNQSVLLDVDLYDSYLSSNDVAYFAPALRSWDMLLYDMSLSALGEVDGLSLNIGNISYGENTHISTSLDLRQVSKIDRAYAVFGIEELTIDPHDANHLMASIAPQLLTTKSEEIITQLGQVVVEGHAEGELDKIIFDGGIKSNIGALTTKSNIDLSQKGTVAFAGALSINDFKLDKIFKDSGLGLMNATTEFNGEFGKSKSQRLWLSSAINSLVFNNYNIQNTLIEGDFNGDNLKGRIICNDSNLMLNAMGSIESLLSQGWRGGRW